MEIFFKKNRTIRDEQEQEKNKPATTISKSIFISSGKVVFFQILGILLGFGLQALISNIFGAIGLGGFTLFISWLGILSAFTVPGLEGTIVYFLPRFENDIVSRRRVIRVCIITVCCISLLCAGILVVSNNWFFNLVGLNELARFPFILSIILFSLGKLLDSVFLGIKDAPSIGYFNVIRTILRILFCLPIFIFPNASWIILFSAIATECGLTLFLRYFRILKRNPELLLLKKSEKGSSPLRGIQILTIAFPMFGIGIIGNLYPYLDKALLGMMLPVSMVGIYKVSESIASLNSFFVAPFVTFWPHISKLYSENKLDELIIAYRNINLAIIALMIPFTLAMIELSNYLFPIFGASFLFQGKVIYLILIIGFIVDAVAGPAGSVLRMTRYSKLSLVISMILLIVYICLSIVLIHLYGLLGAAIAKTIVMVLENATNIIANNILLKIFPYSRTHACLLSCGLMLIIIRYLIPINNLSFGMHLIAAIIQVLIFVGISILVLRSEMQKVIKNIYEMVLRRRT